MRRATSEAKPRMVASKRRGLFKTDRPRAIDRYIDYFGGPSSDPCGEGLLDCFEDRATKERPRLAARS
jgi:hypothetical protein